MAHSRAQVKPLNAMVGPTSSVVRVVPNQYLGSGWGNGVPREIERVTEDPMVCWYLRIILIRVKCVECEFNLQQALIQQ